MDGCRIVRNNENRDRDLPVAVRASHDAIPARLKFHRLRIFDHVANVVVDCSQKLTVFTQDFVIGVITAIETATKMRIRVERRKNHQHAIRARNSPRMGSRPYLIEDQTVSKRGASLKKSNAAEHDKDVI